MGKKRETMVAESLKKLPSNFAELLKIWGQREGLKGMHVVRALLVVFCLVGLSL